MILQTSSVSSWPCPHQHQRFPALSGSLNVKLQNFSKQANFQPCGQPRLMTSWAGHVPNCAKILSIQDELSEPDPDTDSSDQATTSSEESTSESNKPSGGGGVPEFPNKNINTTIAVVSTMAAVALFASSRLDFGVSLKTLSVAALPYEQALSNGKPTVVEFYADWCEVCRELAPDVYKVEQQYKDRVNFVMLNVDNTKWEQELDEFGVEGIPHFAFLDGEGNEEGNIVGRLPRQYLLENVDALSRGEKAIPHARVVGQYSSAEARKPHSVVDPRSHG